ncbi:hypothetical protein RF11_15045 [Thelohanellus kitauei]|uniref:EGF-like domain-containing protein n=1 Tax=Thelohanellus kitauei TaxID=669202 RepID=A0A0C2M9X4_THEKT|nr:hypothetical protein RF11_15045 [Thelohanellus kitauei]
MMNKCKETEGAQERRGTCVSGRCTCPYEYSGAYCETLTVPTVRCSDISKCMVKVYDSNEHVGCNIPVTLVEKLDESTSYFALSCQMIHQNCLRSFMIHINNNVKHIDRITLKRLDPQQDCSQDPNLYFRKRLVKVCGITSAVTIVFYSITILLHYLFLRWRSNRGLRRQRLREWVFNYRGPYDTQTITVDE